MDLSDPDFSLIASSFDYDTRKIDAYQRLMKAFERHDPRSVVDCYKELGWKHRVESYLEDIGSGECMRIAVKEGLDDLAYRLASKRGVERSIVDFLITKRKREQARYEARRREENERLQRAMELYEHDRNAAIEMLGFDPYDVAD